MSEKVDYNELIDEEIWNFIRRTQEYYPDDTTERSIEEQRTIYTGMCEYFAQDHPEGVMSANDIVSGVNHDVPVRRYKTANSNVGITIVYMHGGGFVVGGLDSHDDVCAELCAKTGYKVTAVDYRLAPEHKHPAAFNDCLTCVEHEAQQNPGLVLLCGDSAGGNLAAAVTHRLSTQNHGQKITWLAGQVLIYPELGGDSTMGSYLQHANAPMLSSDEVAYYLQVRVDSTTQETDPSFAPLRASSFANLPDTLVVSAQCDPLSDDGRLYCNAIIQANGRAKWINEPGLVHGFLRARHTSTRARQSFETIVQALKRMGSASSG